LGRLRRFRSLFLFANRNARGTQQLLGQRWTITFAKAIAEAEVFCFLALAITKPQ